MITNLNKSRKKKLLSLCLSAFMLTTAAGTLTACGGGSDSSIDDSKVTTPEKDTARISNGSFEFGSDNDGKTLIITSPTGWSKSTGSSSGSSASSSKSASGIVDTAKWEENFKTSSGLAYDTEAEAKANWDKLKPWEKLKFYENWKKDDSSKKLTDLSFYDAEKDYFNGADFEDVPTCENPLTHNAETTEKNSRVLMIHNAYNGSGTAQKYTSSTSVTLEPGTSAEFSVWVKTEDMTFNGTSDKKGPSVYGLKGAYIGITHTVGGVTLDQLQVKNIDTEALNPDGANNGWVKYNFYLKGSSYASSTFTVVLGLGQGGGTQKGEYVEGYAFFDDAECSIISNEAYDEVTANLPAKTKVDIYSGEDEKLFPVDEAEYAGEYSYAIDLHASFENLTIAPETELTKQKYNNGVSYVSAMPKEGALPEGVEIYGELNSRKLDTSNDLTGLYSLTELRQKIAGYKNVTSAFEKYPEAFGDDVLMLLSGDGAAYTSTVKNSAFTLEAESRMLVSFRVKTSNLNGFTGATVTLHDGDNETSLSSLDTTSVSTVDIDGADGTKIEDIYDGWQQCFFFVENTTEETKSFYLTFSYGPTEIVGKGYKDFYAGFAAFADFEYYKGEDGSSMTNKAFSYAASGTYAKTVTLADDTTASSGTKFDEEVTIPDSPIESGLADLKNYTGVNGGSSYVTDNSSTDGDLDKINDYTVNGQKYAGLVNKDQIENYEAEAQKEGNEGYWLNKLTGSNPSGNWWKNIFGTATQPLLIYNTAPEGEQTKAYGYIGGSQTIAENSYATVAVQVKVSAGAKAYIYLTDTSANKYTNNLTFSTPKLTYWYDDDGNVCAKDPSSKKFDKKTDIAFYLNKDNGLYEVNNNWEFASAYKGKYFANLTNYEEKRDENGNLLGLAVAEGGVSYNYDSDASTAKREGNDGFAFYAKDGKFYAYKNYTTEVSNLADVTELTPRYKHDGNEKQLMMEVNDTQGGWVTCVFYIHTGSEAKNYRLEVWSGSRDGRETPDNDSYVIFDAVSFDAVDSNFSTLIDEAVEDIRTQNNWTKDEFKENYSNAIYHTYSFLDSGTFLRYDKSLDKDEVGNKYASYVSSAYSEGVAYLDYTSSDEPQRTVFVDYSLTDVTVTPDSNDNTDDDVTEDTTTSDTNFWLLISSISMAAILIIVIILMVIQKILKHVRRKKNREQASKISNATALNSAKRRYAPKKEAKPVEKVEPKDENDPYND